ncbi:MAG: Cas9 inhibitor AcrIIA9 family protein, partial [Eubacteriales bacterium]
EDDPVEENGGCDDVDDIKTDVPAGNGASKDADEEKRRAEHETAEAKRKAEWEAKQAEKKRALQEQMDHLAAMSDDEVVSASMQRVSKDVEKLTRRNMKECVSEYIQTLCLDDPALPGSPCTKKTMIHCFQYISRKAWDYVQDELRASGIQPGQGGQGYGCDIPDDLCYQWAEDYFRDPDAKEDQEQEEKFVPKPYWQDHREYRQEKESGKETRRKEEAGTKAGAGKETFC